MQNIDLGHELLEDEECTAFTLQMLSHGGRDNRRRKVSTLFSRMGQKYGRFWRRC
jgi:hypothetical protein